MKMDKDLVREILLAIEASDNDPRTWITLELDGHPDTQVSYHVQLLDEAGYIQAHELSSSDFYDWRPTRLTFQGHEFLDTVRDTETWKQAKATAKELSVGGLKALFEIAKGYGKQRLLQHGFPIG